jgi:hypothetical protein
MTEVRPYRELRETLPAELEAWLHSGEVSAYNYLHPIKPRRLWEIHRERIIREHIEREPGSRPRLWWRWEARESQRLGGIGDPLSAVWPAYVAHYEYGVPAIWYRGEVTPRFPHSLLHRPSPQPGIPISADDPPVYESEAAYLERLNLFRAGERAGLRIGAFDPVEVRVCGDKVGLYATRVR